MNLTCPECSAALSLSEDADIPVCPKCGTFLGHLVSASRPGSPADAPPPPPPPVDIARISLDELGPPPVQPAPPPPRPSPAARPAPHDAVTAPYTPRPVFAMATPDTAELAHVSHHHAGSPEPEVVTPTESPSGDSQDSDATLPEGTIMGNFRIDSLLGIGGMAHVYRATQLSLNRPVALKILASRLARKQGFVERFDREAGALASLTHPNIVNVIDKGSHEDHYFFAMELVDGITLDQLIQSVDLTPRHYTHVVAEISKALAYVHERGIIHRDIKPANVLVTRHGVVKVSDFGIAHITEGDAAPSASEPARAAVGTQHYMAPEQMHNSDAVDARADIYSLGVTFYKMLTRQLPAPVWQPPSTVNPKLPLELDSIIARAMAVNPAERFATVTEFCDAILAAFNPSLRPQAKASDGPGRMASAGLFAGTTFSKRKGDATDPGSDAVSTSALFRPAFLESNFDLEPGTPVPAPSPVRPAPVAVAEPTPPPMRAAPAPEAPDDDGEETSLGRRLLFWLVVVVGVAVLGATVFGLLRAMEII